MAGQKTITHQPWIEFGRMRRPREVRLRLFCFGQAGMGGHAFHGWDALSDDGIEVCPIELPGHGARMTETPLTSLQGMALLLAEALDPLLDDAPFAVFGHSMGAWLAFEWLQELGRRRRTSPVMSFFSANRAPQLSCAEEDTDRETPMLSRCSPEEFWRAFERRYGKNPVLQDKAIREYVLPLLQTDFGALERYQPSTGGVRFDFPVHCLAARGDPRVRPDQISAWKEHSVGEFEEHWFELTKRDGQWATPHRFIFDDPGPVTAFIRKSLVPFCQTSPLSGRRCAVRAGK